MYRRRRLAVLLVLLLIVAGVVLAVWQPWRASGEGPSPSARPATTPTADVSPVPTPSVTQTPDEEPEAEPEDDPEETPTPEPSPTLAVCGAGAVTVSAVTDKQSYAAGEKPKLSIHLVNEGDEECVINVGTAAQAFVVASGTDTWWRSTDCQKKPSDQIVKLEPGRVVESVSPLQWDRTRSSVDTCEGDRPSAQPGYYNLTVTVGGIESDPRQFRLR